MTDRTDNSFSPHSSYGTRRWAATQLGMSIKTMQRKNRELAKAGFPSIDPIVGRYLKADVIAWIESRKRISTELSIVGEPAKPTVNLDAI